MGASSEKRAWGGHHWPNPIKVRETVKTQYRSKADLVWTILQQQPNDLLEDTTHPNHGGICTGVNDNFIRAKHTNKDLQ